MCLIQCIYSNLSHSINNSTNKCIFKVKSDENVIPHDCPIYLIYKFNFPIILIPSLYIQ